MSIATNKEYASGSLVKYDNLELKGLKIAGDFGESFPYWVSSLRLYEAELPRDLDGIPFLDLFQTRLKDLDFSSIYEEEIKFKFPVTLEKLKIQFGVFSEEIKLSLDRLNSLSFFCCDLKRTKRIILGKSINRLDLSLSRLGSSLVIESEGGLKEICFFRAALEDTKELIIKGSKLDKDNILSLQEKFLKVVMID